MQFSVSDAIASLALVLSVIATITTIRFNSRQQSLIETQELLNRRLLEREEADSASARRADLGANLVKIGDRWRLKVFNRGQAPARNVNVAAVEGSDLLHDGDVQAKFPLEILEPQQGVELIALVYLGSQSKHAIQLKWSDAFSDSNEKTVYVTI